MMSSEFVAIDVETANPDISSICQIGIAKFSDNKVIEEWVSLINPEDDFDFFNMEIHGICETDVVIAPTFPEIIEKLRYFLEGNICVCHSHFDRISIAKTLKKYSLEIPDIIWLDSAKVARRTWEEIAHSGYGLAQICQKIGYQFKHHDALEDAKASGHVILAAIERSQIDLASWLKHVSQPINPELSSQGSSIKRIGNTAGKLLGEVIVFTGALNLTRNEAANLAAELGCSVDQNVTKKTTILVVGSQDSHKLAGNEKSSKHRKAEQLIASGQNIKIIYEHDFQELVSTL
jgi:DNA polymerase-3 subunit epsilon